MKQKSAKELALRQMIDHWHTVYNEAVEMGDYALAENTYNVTLPKAYEAFEREMGFPLERV